jgi:hypothetical protein
MTGGVGGGGGSADRRWTAVALWRSTQAGPSVLESRMQQCTSSHKSMFSEHKGVLGGSCVVGLQAAVLCCAVLCCAVLLST